MAIDGSRRAQPTNDGRGGDDSRELSVEELKRRHEQLNTKRITAAANLQTASNELEQLKRDALEKYGTDDLDQLEAQLDAMRQDNERRRGDYQRHLEEIEAKLADVERQFSTKKE